MYLFPKDILSWEEWSRLQQSVPLFSPLIQQIMEKEELSFSKIESMGRAANAVFRTGNYVVKIYFPMWEEIDGLTEMEMEIAALKLADSVGVPTQGIYGAGIMPDKYNFAYLITGYITGIPFSEAVQDMTSEEKRAAGMQLRRITDKLHIPCPSFHHIDVLHDPRRQERWQVYPLAFQKEREEYIAEKSYGPFVFVHGDLNGKNVLAASGELTLIDFADAVSAPKIYEESYIISELFQFDRELINGYFGGYQPEALAEICFDGLLIHDFGGDVIQRFLGRPEQFVHLRDLYDAVCDKL